MPPKKMSESRLRERARKAADAAMADNKMDTGQSIDEVNIEVPSVPRRSARVTAAAIHAAARKPRKAAPVRSAAAPPKKTARKHAVKRPAWRPPYHRSDSEDAVPMGARPPRQDPTAMREPLRDPKTGRIVIVRDGITYTRRQTNVGDKFHIDAADIPDGMSYQWIAVSVVGAEQRNSVANFKANGWREVMMERYPGRYGPTEAKGHVIIDGQGLYERPEELTREARGEEIAAARALIRTRNDQFVPRLPEARSRRGTELRAKRSIEGMPTDVGRPVYQMDVDDGLVA